MNFWNGTKKGIRYFLTMALGVCLSTFLVPQAQAEFVKFDKEKLYAPPTTSEDVVLDFIKLAKIQTPEFEKMIVKTEKYKKTPSTEQIALLQDEMLRLNKRFLTLNPEKEGILIRIAVKVYFENMSDRQSFLTIKFPSEGLVYFPYYYGGLPVAVLVNGIEDFQKIYLTEEERQQVAAIIDPTPDTTLILDLKPTGASITKPVILDGEQQFALLCDIAYIGIHNKQSDQVWGWKAQTDEDKEDPTGLKSLGSVKPEAMDTLPPTE